MSYNSVTDFIGLLRSTVGGMRSVRMPGLDYVVAALNRAGIFSVYVGSSAPTTNQSSTVWVVPATPSWSAECAVFLWNAAAGAYQAATPTLWAQFFSPSGYNYQSVTAANDVIAAGRSLVALNRGADPIATGLTLPAIANQFPKPLQIVDWSTNSVDHTITLTPSGGATIMQRATMQLVSTPAALAGATLFPCPDLNAWVLTP